MSYQDEQVTWRIERTGRTGRVVAGVAFAGALAAIAVVAAQVSQPADPVLVQDTAVEVDVGPGESIASTTAGDESIAATTVGDESVDQAPDPTAVRIPTIDVDASTTPLGIRDDGKIEVPEDFQQTGWWKDGPEPGEIGPAVILGHVDSRDGPAVFYELNTLSVGDPIHIDRADGSTVTYVVDRVEQHPKTSFPTEAVYGSTDQSVLRLVTCGGSFDSEARSYRDNIIVFASLQAG